METPSYSTQTLDHLGIVAGICHEIGLIEQIDRLLLGPGLSIISVQRMHAIISCEFI